MNTFIVLAVAFFAVVGAQVNNLRLNTIPIDVTPNTPVTTSFSNQLGSQFKLWVPSNASQINLQWSRSATGSGCQSGAYAYLYGKMGTYPCSINAYPSLDAPCKDYVSFGYSATSPISFSFNASYFGGLSYWYSGGYGDDFIRGDYLYLTSYLDINANCTATLTASLDYCSAGTIAASTDNSQDSNSISCETYTTVNSRNYTEVGNNVAPPFTKNWLVTLPNNVSGVSIGVKHPTSATVYLYGRESSGGSYYDNYQYGFGSNNFSLWMPNPAPGEFVLTLYAPNAGANITFDIDISVQTCADGIAADRNGACYYPLTQVTTAQLSYLNVSVPSYNPSLNTDCNWSFLAYTVPAETLGYMNLTFTLPSSNGRTYWRRNAIPNSVFYDGYFTSDYAINFTPEDFYASNPVTYYFGFCNTNTDAYAAPANFTIQGPPAPSPSPSPSRSPSPSPVSPSPSPSPSSGAIPSPSKSPVANPSPSSSPDSDSSSGSQTSVGVYALLLVVGSLLLLLQV